MEILLAVTCIKKLESNTPTFDDSESKQKKNESECKVDCK